MKFNKTHLEGLYVIHPNVLSDDRGSFTRTFSKDLFSSIGFSKEFVQFNHSFNKQKGTLRGMHYQDDPFAETKLIRCVEGSVYDVSVDVRKNSPTYLQYFGIILSKINMYSILIPEGFAHGFQTLEDNTSLIYHHTQFYTPEVYRGVHFNDPVINIDWPLPVVNVSEQDNKFSLIEKI